MDPNAGNPFMKGGNPYMQAQTPAAGGQMDPGMAPPGEGGGTSVTTKPRQLPGGAPPPPMGMPGGDMPLGPGGAGAPPPMAMPGMEQTTDTNVPQTPQKPATAMRLKVQAIRREIMVANPEVPTEHAHAIALAVVALQSEAASPMGPLVTPGTQQRARHSDDEDWANAHQRQRSQRQLPHGDLNDPSHPYWRANGGHPYARSTVSTPNVQHGHPAQDALAEPGDWVSQYGGRNPLEDHAFAQGYRGNAPHWYALTDKVLNAVMPRKQKNTPAPPPVR